MSDPTESPAIISLKNTSRDIFVSQHIVNHKYWTLKFRFEFGCASDHDRRLGKVSSISLSSFFHSKYVLCHLSHQIVRIP